MEPEFEPYTTEEWNTYKTALEALCKAFLDLDNSDDECLRITQDFKNNVKHPRLQAMFQEELTAALKVGNERRAAEFAKRLRELESNDFTPRA
jgi:hypothetical protein